MGWWGSVEQKQLLCLSFRHLPLEIHLAALQVRHRDQTDNIQEWHTRARTHTFLRSNFSKKCSACLLKLVGVYVPLNLPTCTACSRFGGCAMCVRQFIADVCFGLCARMHVHACCWDEHHRLYFPVETLTPVIPPSSQTSLRGLF